jgi:outer membrane protein, heavy metal efflux system
MSLSSVRSIGGLALASPWLLAGVALAAPQAPPAPVPAAPAPVFYAPESALARDVGRALERNPGIQEAEARYRAALQQVPQVTALPDPMVGVTQSIRSPETRVGPQAEAFTVSQAFPWFGTLDLRGAVARAGADAAREAVAIRQWDVVLQVKQTFYNLAYLDAALRVTQEEQALLGQYEQLAESRYAAGQSPQEAVIKLQAEITKVLSRRQDLQGQRAALAARLNTLMNDPPATPVPAIGELAVPPVTTDRTALSALGDAHRPELAASQAMQRRAESAITLARTNFRPNFTLSAGFANVLTRRDAPGLMNPPPDNGKNPLSVSFAVTVPIHRGKYRASVAQAAEDLSAERDHFTVARNAMTDAIEEQIARLDTLREQLDLFQRVLIPQSQEALRSSESAYSTGQVGVLDLLDSERVLLDVRLVIARQRADYLIALATLERAIGYRFPDTASQSRSGIQE